MGPGYPQSSNWGTHRASKYPVPLSLLSPQLLPGAHSGTPSPVQGCAKPRQGKLPKQTSHAVPWCTHLSRAPWKYSTLSGSCPRSLLGFSCYLSPAEGAEWATWSLLPGQRGGKESPECVPGEGSMAVEEQKAATRAFNSFLGQGPAFVFPEFDMFPL